MQRRWAICLLAGLTRVVVASDAPALTPVEAALLSSATTRYTTNLAATLAVLEPELGDDRSGALHTVAAQTAAAVGRADDALRWYDRAIELAPDFADPRLGRAQTLLLLGRTLESVAAARDAVRLAPGDARGYRLLGHALALAGEGGAAADAFRQAHLLAGRAEDRQALLSLLLEQKRYTEALPAAQDAVREHPQDAGLRRLLVSILAADGQRRAALAVAEEARRLGAADTALLNLAGDLWAAEAVYGEARAAYEAAWVLEPTNPVPGIGLARVEMAQGEFAAVTQTLARIRAVGVVAGAPALELEVGALLELGAHTQALERVHAALEADPLNGRLLLRLADVHTRMGATESARLAFERATHVADAAATAWLRWGVLEAGQGRHTEAIGLLEKSLELRDDPEVRRYTDRVRDLAAGERRRP